METPGSEEAKSKEPNEGSKPTVGIRPNRFSLTKKLSLLLFTIVVVAIGVYAAYAVWTFRDDKLKYVHTVNASMNQTIGRKIQSEMESLDNDMKNIVLLLGSKNLDEDKTKIVKGLFQNNASFAGLYLVKEAFPLKVSYALLNKDLLELKSLTADQVEHFILVETERLQGQSEKQLSQMKPEWGLTLYFHPIRLNETLWVIFLVNQDYVYEAVMNSDLSEALVVNGEGRIVASKEKSHVGTSVAHWPLFKLALEAPGSEGGVEQELTDSFWKGDYVGNFYRLNPVLFLFSISQKEQAFAGMQKLIYNTLLFALNIAALAIIIGLLLAKSLTAPLKHLMQATENIAAGNYNVHPDVKTKDEIGQLADYFTQLGQRLTEREEALEQVTELAIRDGMTGIYNHRHFKVRANEFFALAQRHNQPLSLILSDIDHFKKFNDTYGHQQGDVVIKDIAKILVDSTRSTDFVARYGGEEFVIALPQTNRAAAVQIAERIRENFQNHKIKNIVGGEDLSGTCSLGVSTFEGHNYAGIDDMIKQADDNLYKAKKGGRNQVVSD